MIVVSLLFVSRLYHIACRTVKPIYNAAELSSDVTAWFEWGLAANK